MVDRFAGQPPRGINVSEYPTTRWPSIAVINSGTSSDTSSAQVINGSLSIVGNVTASGAVTVTDTPSSASPFTEAALSFSASGDNTIITGTTAQTIKVYRIILSSTASTSLTFKDGSTALSGAIPISSSSLVVLDCSGSGFPWFKTTSTNSFVINSSATASIGGTISYVQGA